MLKATNSSNRFSINRTLTSTLFNHTMDQLITIDEVAEFLKKILCFPTAGLCKSPGPTQIYLKALKPIECPQSLVHGWSGLIMDPALYILPEPKVFVIPISPGATAIYPKF